MSENQQEGAKNAIAENEQKVVITGKDCRAALEYWEHFKIPQPAALVKAIENFEKDGSFANQVEIKYQVCKALVESDHESFKDEMFTKILTECRKVLYSLQFDRDLDTTLTTTANQSNTSNTA